MEAAARECGVVIDQHTDAKALRAALDAASPDGVFGDDRLPKRIERIDATTTVSKKKKSSSKKSSRAEDRQDRRRVRRRGRDGEDGGETRGAEETTRAGGFRTSAGRVEARVEVEDDVGRRGRRLRDARRWRRCCGDGGERGEYLEDAKALFAARAVRLAAREAEARAAMEEGEALPDEDEDGPRGLGARASDAADDDERTVQVRVEVAVEAKTTTTTAREDAGANEPDGAARGERRAA